MAPVSRPGGGLQKRGSMPLPPHASRSFVSKQPAIIRRGRCDAQARAAVRELAARGVDFIKILRRTGPEAFRAIADESKRVGLASRARPTRA